MRGAERPPLTRCAWAQGARITRELKRARHWPGEITRFPMGQAEGSILNLIRTVKLKIAVFEHQNRTQVNAAIRAIAGAAALPSPVCLFSIGAECGVLSELE